MWSVLTDESEWQWDTIIMLRRLLQFVAVLMALTFSALPAVACMVPDWQMTAEEQMCCEKMAHSCEVAAMPGSHSCCQHPASQDAANPSRVQADRFELTVEPLTALVLALAPPVFQGSCSTFESPPEDPPPTVSILRI